MSLRIEEDSCGGPSVIDLVRADGDGRKLDVGERVRKRGDGCLHGMGGPVPNHFAGENAGLRDNA